MNPTNALSDVRLADEGACVYQLPAEHLAEHFQHHIGVDIFGKSGGKDILFVGTGPRTVMGAWRYNGFSGPRASRA